MSSFIGNNFQIQNVPPLLHVDSQSSTQSYCLSCGWKTNSHIYGSLGAKQCLAGSESLTFKQLRITSGITATWPLLHLQNKWNLPWNKDDSKQYKQTLQTKKSKTTTQTWYKSGLNLDQRDKETSRDVTNTTIFKILTICSNSASFKSWKQKI